MSENFFEYLTNFVKTEHPYSPRLSAYCIGGGASLAHLMCVPGSSKLVSGIYLPYDNNVVATELDETIGSEASIRYMEKAVQAKVALDLAEMARRKNPDGVGIGVTAALTTNRYRKGDTHAFIAFTESDWKIATVHHVSFKKMEENYHSNENVVARQRLWEDEILSRLVISIVYGFENDLFNDLCESGVVKEVS